MFFFDILVQVSQKSLACLIKKWFNIDYSKHIIKQNGYEHLTLNEKQRIINKIKIPEISVCEDEDKAYKYWIENFNPNKEDCCNLRRNNGNNK